MNDTGSAFCARYAQFLHTYFVTILWKSTASEHSLSEHVWKYVCLSNCKCQALCKTSQFLWYKSRWESQEYMIYIWTIWSFYCLLQDASFIVHVLLILLRLTGGNTDI